MCKLQYNDYVTLKYEHNLYVIFYLVPLLQALVQILLNAIILQSPHR